MSNKATVEGEDHITLGDMEIHDLTCDMTTVEIIRKVDEQSEILDELELIDAEFSKAKERHNGKKKGLETRLSEIREVLKSKKETRGITCQYQYNWTTNQKHLMRLDITPPESVHDLEITEVERQQNLKGIPAGVTPDESEEDDGLEEVDSSPDHGVYEVEVGE